jgi:hypothetical protein
MDKMIQGNMLRIIPEIAGAKGVRMAGRASFACGTSEVKMSFSGSRNPWLTDWRQLQSPVQQIAA